MASAETVDVVIIGSGMGGATLRRGSRRPARGSSFSSAASVCATVPTRATRARFFSAAFFVHRRRGSTARASRSIRASTITSAAIRSSTARSSFAIGVRTSRPIELREGATPGWPFPYEEMEPWYCRAEKLYQVRGAVGHDPTEPRHSAPYPLPPVPDEPAIAEVRERLEARRPAPVLAAARRRHRKVAADARRRRGTHFPTPASGKMDAETCGLKAALAHPNVELRDDAQAERLSSRRTASASRASRRVIGGERDADPPSSSCFRRRGQFGGACCCRRARAASPIAPTRSAVIS